MQKQTTEQKHKILMQYIKAHEKDKDDPLGDTKIFDREVARYFKVEQSKNRAEIMRDWGKKEHSYMVRTDMFGGKMKHLSTKYFRNFQL